MRPHHAETRISKDVRRIPEIPIALSKRKCGFKTIALLAVSSLVISAPSPMWGADSLYEPVKNDFPCPQPTPVAYGKGSCDAYFSWIDRFYRGTIFVRGWTYHAQELLSNAPEGMKLQLTSKLNNLGRMIAAEWAKENGYRRIYSTAGQGYPNLEDLFRRASEARLKDTGDGKTVEQFLDIALGVAEKAIRGKTLSDKEKVWMEYFRGNRIRSNRLLNHIIAQVVDKYV